MEPLQKKLRYRQLLKSLNLLELHPLYQVLAADNQLYLRRIQLGWRLFFLFERRENNMLTKTFTFTDFNGEERTEQHQFNLTKTEIAKLELGTTGGLSEMIRRIIESKDTPEIIKIFEDIVLKSYGEKSADGRQFIKDEEKTKAFMQTPAYDQLFLELIGDANKAAQFIVGIVPSEIAKKIGSEVEEVVKSATQN